MLSAVTAKLLLETIETGHVAELLQPFQLDRLGAAELVRRGCK
jgi:hypothetical protein